ncbi:MAG: hypothetical protein IJP17_01040, partial [Clostridia bacterium]|nr:hypothetical protein [Clostridia bacterium]
MKSKVLQEIWDPSTDFIERNADVIRQINELDFSKRSDTSLKVFAQWIKSQISSDEDAANHLITVFALTKEAAKRTLGFNAYDCQLLAGIVMYEGKLAEMYSGEGKTLAAVFPAVMHALSGHRVHIITFNDYLVERDYSLMRPVFELLGISVGFITAATERGERRELYRR